MEISCWPDVFNYHICIIFEYFLSKSSDIKEIPLRILHFVVADDTTKKTTTFHSEKKTDKRNMFRQKYVSLNSSVIYRIWGTIIRWFINRSPWEIQADSQRLTTRCLAEPLFVISLKPINRIEILWLRLPVPDFFLSIFFFGFQSLSSKAFFFLAALTERMWSWNSL